MYPHKTNQVKQKKNMGKSEGKTQNGWGIRHVGGE